MLLSQKTHFLFLFVIVVVAVGDCEESCTKILIGVVCVRTQETFRNND